MIALATLCPPSVLRAEWSDDKSDHAKRWPVYQRHAFEWKHNFRDRRGQGRHFSPQINSAWFQRPYPYHLDYYRMRYGGSYAPYFGNLYGPPQVVTAPPYYGPYYGDYGFGPGNGYPGDYAGGPAGGALPGNVPMTNPNGGNPPADSP